MFRSLLRRIARRIFPETRLSDLRRRHGRLPAIGDDVAILKTARVHLSSGVGRNLPDPGQRWKAYSVMTRRVAAAFLSPLEAIRFAQDPSAHNGFETRAKKALLHAIAQEQDESLAAQYPAFALTLAGWSESKDADPESTIEHNGRPVSSSMYLLTSFCMFCLERMRPRTVCEIGGGYGAPARLWLTNPIHRPNKYIIVDLPESLFFAELYLSRHFGAENICYVDNTSPAAAARVQSSQIVLCPNGFIQMLRPLEIDLVTNTNSMQEMSEDYIDFFMAWLDTQNCRHFFSVNFSLQDIRDLRESQNTWSPRLSPIWKTLYMEHMPDDVRPTTMALYEKSSADIQDRRAAAEDALRSLLRQRLNQHALAKALDHIRLTMQKETILQLLTKISSEYPFTPKEAVYLKSRL